jgi:PAS domain S-box-containing protein
VYVWNLTTASENSAAGRGWNELVKQGRRWQALHELAQSLENQLQSQEAGEAGLLLDTLPEGVAKVDPAGSIRYANSALAAMCGKASSEQILGQDVASGFGLDAKVAERLQLFADRRECVLEWSIPAQQGQSRTLRGNRRVLADPNGGSKAFVWSIRDVTQQRLAEAKLEQFLSAAAHEFRTPLTNIRAYAESLDLGHDIDAEDRKRFYNVIQSESLRLSQLVDDLLDISRMQAGGLMLDSRETDLGRLVEEAAAKVQAQVREKNLQFRCELPAKVPKASVDKSKLTAALVNLLGNAAKYTPSGGSITFRFEVAATKAEFSVIDTGIGIAADELPHVFDRFFRSGDDRVREISGSGLGLALAQEVARLHGGDISVQSTLGQGSTFRLSIPLDLAV